MTIERNRKLNRNRVKKHRVKTKLLNEYENAVRLEMNKRISEQNALNSGSTSVNPEIIKVDQHENEKNFNLENALQIWALKHRITHMAVKDLLSILNSAGISSEFGKPLPKDSRTVLKTPAHVDIQTLTVGNLWYRGVQKCLENIFKNINRDVTITLNFNFDGVPLYNSSKICFWPILPSIRGSLLTVNSGFASNFSRYCKLCNEYIFFFRISENFTVCGWNMVWYV